MTTGRPTKYKEEFVEQVYKLCLLGATDIEIADFFSVCEDTINNWKVEYPEFFVSIKKGKDTHDSDKVERSLRDRAIGYSHDEQKIFNDNGSAMVVDTTKHYPPDTTAAIFWLKNRQPERWRDKSEVDNKLSGEVKSTIDTSKLKEVVKEVLAEDDC